MANSWPGVGEVLSPKSQILTYAHGVREVRHLAGGAPAYWLYLDLPWINLHRLLSGPGTTLLGLGLMATAAFLARGVVEKKPEEKPAGQKPLKIRIPRPRAKKASPPPPPPPPPKPRRKLTRAYTMPPASLLREPERPNQANLKKDLKEQAEILEQTLMNFGIEAKVGEINCGPTITSFEVIPAVGVKVQKIKTLEKDIALNLQARSIRIIAPIPGKAAVGIEVPNPHPTPVSFKELLSVYRRSGKMALPLLLGKSVSGTPVIHDLARMPHLIIAGATGSGKSVCVNTIIMSLLMNLRPEEVRLLMVDPKKVELTPYSNLPHMLAPVVTEAHEAYLSLTWLVKEMERRYEKLKETGVRNIASYNAKASEGMPYIVGIVDELADLMMASSSDIETPITRIAQMARAVGIHLILATQRPSREVITGLIKANFPARIAFQVANRINSQIILDETGAETLLGMGDMLILPPGTSQLVRAQGTFVSDDEINATIHHICEQMPPKYEISSFQEVAAAQAEESEKDSLYDEAYGIVVATGAASTTYLQRKLKIGYARAASIMDQLEQNGVIGPQEGAKPRRVLIK